MFEVTVNVETLLNAINYISPAIPSNDLIYLESTDMGSCILFSNNAKCSIEVEICCSNATQKDYSGYINCKILKQLLHNMNMNSTITIKEKNNVIHLIYDKNTKDITLNTRPSCPLAKPQVLATTPLNSATIPTSIFTLSVRNAIAAIDKDDSTVTIDNCCKLTVNKDKYNVQAVNKSKQITYTTSYVLNTQHSKQEYVFNVVPVEKCCSMFSSFLTLEVTQDSNNILIYGKDKIQNNYNSSEVKPDILNVKYVGHKMNVKYPNLGALSNTSYQPLESATFLSEALLTSLNKAIALSDDNSKDITFEINDMNMVTSIKSVHGEMQEAADIKIGVTKPIKGLFDVHTIYDICKSLLRSNHIMQVGVMNAPSGNIFKFYIANSTTGVEETYIVSSKYMNTTVPTTNDDTNSDVVEDNTESNSENESENNIEETTQEVENEQSESV